MILEKDAASKKVHCYFNIDVHKYNYNRGGYLNADI